jgi:hypothetical protein
LRLRRNLHTKRDPSSLRATNKLVAHPLTRDDNVKKETRCAATQTHEERFLDSLNNFSAPSPGAALFGMTRARSLIANSAVTTCSWRRTHTRRYDCKSIAKYEEGFFAALRMTAESNRRAESRATFRAKSTHEERSVDSLNNFSAPSPGAARFGMTTSNTTHTKTVCEIAASGFG